MQNYKPGKAAFIFIFITVALDMLAVGVMIPVLPKLIVSFEGGNFGQGSRVVGYFGIAWAFMQFMCQPILGALSDRFGRRPVVLLSNLAMGVDYVIMALAPNLAWLFIGRLISGAAAASTSTASAYIADITPPEKRAARFGMLGAAFGLGFVLGPAIGGMLGQIDLRLPFWGAAGFCLLNATYGFFVLPESLAPENRSKSFVWKTAHVFGSMKFLSREPGLGLLSLAIFLSYLAYESLPSLFVLYTDYRYHWDAKTTGMVLATGRLRPDTGRGGSGPAGGQTLRRDSNRFDRTGLRHRGLPGLCLGPDRDRLHGRAAAGGAVGIGYAGLSGAGDAIGRSVAAGRVARSARQPARRDRHDRSDHLHPDPRLGNRRRPQSRRQLWPCRPAAGLQPRRHPAGQPRETRPGPDGGNGLEICRAALARKKFLPICGRGNAQHIGEGMNTKFAAFVMAMSLAMSLGISGEAQAKGCIRGAIAGGIAGHYAGHHTWTGAAAGCIAGRHYYKQKRLEQQQQVTAPAPTPADPTH